MLAPRPDPLAAAERQELVELRRRVRTLESELIDRTSWATPAEARPAVFDYIEVFYDRTRRHSALGYLSPDEFERRYRPVKTPAA